MVDLKNRNNLVVSTGPYTSFTDLVEFFPIKYDYLGSFQTIFLTYVSRKWTDLKMFFYFYNTEKKGMTHFCFIFL